MEPFAESHPTSDPNEGEAAGTSPKEIALFALRAARHNWKLCVSVAVLIGVLGSTAASAVSPTFDSTCKIFVQDGGSVTSELASGRARRPVDGSRGLEEFILARDNLLSIVREAKLVDTWPRTRALPMRIKDRLQAALLGPPARKDMERGFIEMLGRSITAVKEGESVRIHAQWRDRENAYDIARLVQRNFLSARAAVDMGPIRRAVALLEAQLQEADAALEDAVSRMQSARQSAPTPAATGGASAPAEATRDSSHTELVALSRQLADNRRQQRALKEPWRERIAELKTKLIDLKASYSDDHALVRQQEARIAAASEEPEELTALREKESELLSALSKRGISKAAIKDVAISTSPMAQSENDPDLVPHKARLEAALRKAYGAAERLETAHIELATAEADFNHRYVVVEQPELPLKPLKPMKKPMMFAGALLAALLVGLLSGLARELMKGKLVEPWQVRSLGLELLGEVDLKKLTAPKG